MTYALMILILLLVIAPVVAIVPTAKQKAKMKKRRQAMTEGIRVDLTHIDDPDPNPDKYLSNTGKPLERRLSITAYRLYRRRAGPVMTSPWQFDRTGSSNAGWLAVDTDLNQLPDNLRTLLQSELSLLSNDVIRIEEKQDLVSVYWHELSDADRILDFLKRTVEVDIQ